MTNCPECESKINLDEPFCPVCGIALAVKNSGPVPEAEDPLESTIMMAPEDLSKLVGEKPAKQVDESVADNSFAESPELFTVPSEVETGDTAEDIPAPVFTIDSIRKTSDNLKPAQTGQYPLDAENTDQAIPSSMDDREPEELESDRLRIDEELKVESSDLESSSQIGVGDDIAHVGPYVDEGSKQSTAAHADDRIKNDDVLNGISDPDGWTPEVQIEKPDVDLPEFLAESSVPIYDSVRIIATDGGESAGIAPELAGNDETHAAAENAEVQHDSNVETESSGEIRSQTTPNMGSGTTDGRKRSKLQTLTEGSVLNNRYEIIRKIGGGGMGAVYLASDNNLGGVLRAVKEMVQAHIEEDQQEKAINDFKRESMILSSLDHPSIPTIFDYFYDETECRFYLVMKYISGGDLSARLKSAVEGKLDELTVTEWALQIIDVLDYLHNQPSTIVYRDLKPSNIMIDGNSGRIMLIDFGIARAIGQMQEKGVTAVGTMGYAPPELFSGNVEPRSDIYSLGSTMFHLLTGADPQSNPLLIFDFQKNPRPRQINPRLTDQIEQILMRSVEYSSESRFSSASEMKQVLEQHMSNLRAGNVTYGVSEAPIAVSLENQIVFCGFCGQRIVATDMFCAFCGAKQPMAQQGVHSGSYVKVPVTARLLIEGTAELTTPAYSLQKDETLLGRRDPMSNIFPEVDLSKFDPQTKVSRRHARIWREGGKYLVEDLGSSNGTMIAAGGSESVRLTPHRPHLLASGDKIRVGDTTLHFVVE